MQWLNEIVGEMWPYMDKAVSNMVKVGGVLSTCLLSLAAMLMRCKCRSWVIIASFATGFRNYLLMGAIVCSNLQLAQLCKMLSWRSMHLFSTNILRIC